jgi:hypothetical protein
LSQISIGVWSDDVDISLTKNEYQITKDLMNFLEFENIDGPSSREIDQFRDYT